MSMSTTTERAALYYPYIHIRSEHWLKATLLNFPKVYRMVPIGNYFPEDEDNIKAYTAGDLLDDIDTSCAPARDAQRELLAKLTHREHEKKLLKRYKRVTKRRAPREKYLIHAEKLDVNLKRYLLGNKLAWPDSDLQAKGHRNWLGLDANLGSAVMSTLTRSYAYCQFRGDHDRRH